MIRINILSPQSKKNLKLRHLHNALKNINFIIILVTTTVTLMLLFARIIIRDSFNDVVAQTSLITKNSQSYNMRVREINSKIGSVEKIQQDFYTWSDLIGEIAEITPDEITFSQITVSPDAKNKATVVHLEGMAKTRDRLLAFKDRLERIDYFSKVDLPLATLFEKQDITFKLSLNIDLEKL